MVDGAGREQLSVGDMGDLVAAFGFVHVMGGDQYRQPSRGQRMNLVPEIPPRLRIDAGGLLVPLQRNQIWVWGCGVRKPSPPSARCVARQLLVVCLWC